MRSWFNINIVFASLFLFAATSISAAEMPQYQMLTPITENLSAPHAIAVDSNENIYVTEVDYYRLRIYSHRDEHVEILTGLDRPISVAVDVDGRIFVGNYYDTTSNLGNVEVYDSSLDFLFKLGAGDGEFKQPNAIAIDDSSGNIYVADKEAHVVKVYLPDGTPSFSFDGTAGGGGQFTLPTSIAIDQINGEVIVLDRPLEEGSDGARIQFFNLSGDYLTGFNPYSDEQDGLNMPKHLTVDNEGRIYVTDSRHDVVQVFDRDGTYLGAVWDEVNEINFGLPMGLTINGGNRLFVVDTNFSKVEVFGINTYTQMEASPLSLTFDAELGGAPAALQGVDISNSGDGTLNWTAETGEGWIVLSETAGSAGPSSSATLNIGVDLDGLTAGTYAGSVSVSAESGATEIVEVELTVTGTLPTPPTADPGGPYSEDEGQTVMLDGSASSDPDGTIDLYEWDIDNDGTYDYSSSSPIQNHTYTQENLYTIKLRVTDNDGETNEATTTADISDASPTADFTASPTSGSPPLAVDFTNSSTGHDQPLTYEWDFDNDGTLDSTDTNPSHIYNDSGTYTIQLTVTDSDGSVDSLTRVNYIQAATECQNAQVRIGAVDYPSIQAAYDDPQTVDGVVIMIRAGSINESLSIDRDITVNMIGGHSCDYLVIEGITTLNGDIDNSSGQLTIGNFIIN